jgi:hypothetical protein
MNSVQIGLKMAIKNEDTEAARYVTDALYFLPPSLGFILIYLVG